MGEEGGGEVGDSESHERVVERVDARDDFVPHQSWNILRRRKGKMREVPRVVQR